MFEQLAAPFPPELVSFRVGSLTKNKDKALGLAYIDARDVQNRLDQACTPGGWQARYIPMPNNTMCCEIGIKCGDEWVWKANGADASDMEGAKGVYSDALKRAAVMWGVGRYLYDFEARYYPINEYKQFSDGDLAKMRNSLPRPNGSKPAALSPKLVNTPAPEKPAPDWKKISAGLDDCNTDVELDRYLYANKAAIDTMPEHWIASWVQRETNARNRIAGKVAA